MNEDDNKGYIFEDTAEGSYASTECKPETNGVVQLLCKAGNDGPVWDTAYIEYCGKLDT